MHSLAKISTYLSEKILAAPIKQLFEFWKIIIKKKTMLFVRVGKKDLEIWFIQIWYHWFKPDLVERYYNNDINVK